MSEWEGEMACAQREDLPTALILFNVIGDGEEQGFCTVEYLGGKGIAAQSLLAGVQWAEGLNHRDPFLPLQRLD